MANTDAQRPTEGELEILSVLWSRGPSTVRAVWEELSRVRSVGYTTVLKLMQIMAEKGLVDRDERRQSHVYSARRPREHTERLLLRDLIDRAFDGSMQKLILRAVDSKTITPQELAQIRALFDSIEGGRR